MGVIKRKLPAVVSVIILAAFVAGISMYFCARQGNGRSSSFSSDMESSEKEREVVPVGLPLFSDVSDWTPSEWSLDSHTLTREISEETGVKIKATVPAQDADLQLSLLLIKNRLPDLMIIQNPNMVKKLISSGKVWNLDEFFNEYTDDGAAEAALSAETRKKLVERDGGWYCLPTGMNQNDITGSDISVIWNRKLAAEYGITAESVGSTSAFTAALEKAAGEAQNSDTSLVPVLFGGNEDNYEIAEYLAGSFGAKQSSPQIWEEQGGRSALALINGLLRKKLLIPETLACSKEQTEGLVNDGNVLCFIGDISHMEFDADGWISYGPVKLDGKTEPVLKCRAQSDAGWPCIMISKGCTDLADTGRFIALMESGQVARMIEKYNADYSNWWIYENPCWDACLDKDSAWSQHEEKIHALEKTGGEVKLADSACADAEDYDFSTLAGVIAASSDSDFDSAYRTLLNRISTDGQAK